MKLVAQGGDVNYRAESEGKTPLHAAVIEGNLSCVEFLIQAGANVNPVDTWSWTPLHYAVLHGKVKCAILLVKRYADVAVKDRDGNSPLNIAVMNQQADCVTLLRLTQLSLQETPQHRDATSFATALKEFSASLDSNQPKDQNKDGNSNNDNSSNSPILLPSLASLPSSTANPTSTQSQAQSFSSSSSVSASASTSALPKLPPTSPPVQQQSPTMLVATQSQTIVDVPPVRGQPMGLPFAAQHPGEGPLSPSRSGPPTRAAPAPGHISTTTTTTTSSSTNVPVGGGGSQIRRVPPSVPPPSPHAPHSPHAPGNLPQPQIQPSRQDT
jgi:hypothetical protein